MKRYVNFIGLIVLALLLMPGAAMASRGTARVSLLKKTSDEPSMAKSALKPEAKWVIDGDEHRIVLEFMPLEFMGTRGFLGEVSMDGKKGKVLSSYKEYDSYNHPKTGKDKKLRGKLYPKTVEFVVDPNKSTYNLTFYVPVMGEMGFGEQEARLKIQWPAGTGTAEKKESAEKKELPQNTSSPLNLEDGLYSLPVSLWHESEDKPSMGNGALDEKAEILVKDGRATLYLGTKALKVSNIQASLCRVFYETDEGLRAAKPLAYDLKVDGESLPRPSIFALPLEKKADWMKVKVDPKVAPMGDEPLNARLKMDFSKLQKMEMNQSELLQRGERGGKKPSFKDAHSYVDKGVELSVPAEGFGEDFEFYANALMGNDLQNKLQQLKLPVGTKGYRLEARAPIETIPKDFAGKVQSLGKSLAPQKTVRIAFPFKGNSAEVLNEKGQKIPATIKNGKLFIETKQLGTFFIKTGGSIPKAKGGFTIKPPAKVKTVKPAQAQAVKPVQRVKPAQAQSITTQPAQSVSPAPASAAESAAPSENVDSAESSPDDEWDGNDSPPEENPESDPVDAGNDTAAPSVEKDLLQEKERPGLIILFFILILAALGGGVYLTQKYYRMYMDELMYEADREREER